MPSPSGLVAFYLLGLSFAFQQPNGFVSEGRSTTRNTSPPINA